MVGKPNGNGLVAMAQTEFNGIKSDPRASTPVQSNMGNIDLLFQEIEKHISMCRETLGALEERINPVLRPDAPSDVDHGAEANPEQSIFADRLLSLLNTLRNHHFRIHAINDRVDL